MGSLENENGQVISDSEETAEKMSSRAISALPWFVCCSAAVAGWVCVRAMYVCVYVGGSQGVM